jgi:hypothetical protein
VFLFCGWVNGIGGHRCCVGDAVDGVEDDVVGGVVWADWADAAFFDDESVGGVVVLTGVADGGFGEVVSGLGVSRHMQPPTMV